MANAWRMSSIERDCGCIDEDHLAEHAVEFIPCFSDAFCVVAVHHENEPLGVGEVVPPERTNLRHQPVKFRHYVVM